MNQEHEQYLGIPSKYTVEAFTSENQMEIEDQKDELPKIFYKFLNYFGECNGFQILMHHLSCQTPPLSFQGLELFLKLLKHLLPFLNQKLQFEFFSCLKIEIMKRFCNLTEKEIKDIDKDFLMRILVDCQYIMSNLSEKETYEMTETVELDLSYKFLVSPYFEKRLKGINSLNEIAEKIDNLEKPENPAGISKISTCKYLTPQLFLEWLREKKIVQTLLGDSLHIEILKRCFNFIFY